MKKNESKKRISDIVRKLLNSNKTSIKTAALYLNCTEQSFRNKLSRDSFSLRDLMILCYLCNARFMIEYLSYKADDEIDYFNPFDYIPEDDYTRIQQIQHKNFNENLPHLLSELSKVIPEDELLKMSPLEAIQYLVQDVKKNQDTPTSTQKNNKIPK